jgi:ribulose-phosphate 3-epimerase
MTVNPGFTGQKFIPRASLKIDLLHRLRDEQGYSYEIAVDGGVSLSNAGELVERGADILIMGAAVFRAVSPSKVVAKIRELKR